MARTKQTARKSTGGHAPRKQLATKASRSLKQFFRSQQSSGFSAANGEVKQKIFINCENTFASFSFLRQRTDRSFQMAATTTRVRSDLLLPNSTNNINGDIIVKIDFLSNLDGNLKAEQRPPIDVVFVLDISGSMSMRFPDDSDNRDKLAVAKDCILKITEQLLPTDRAAVAIFNDSADTIFNLSYASKGNLTKLKKKLSDIKTSGGTNLSTGLQHGYSIVRENNKKNKEDNTLRLQRVFFLTDMESTSDDENRVIAIAKFQALVDSNNESTIPMDGDEEGKAGWLGSSVLKSFLPTMVSDKKEIYTKSVHLSVVGIGVDLSVATVERISSIPGAKYCSVINSSEFIASVVEGFNFDITPIAFDISLKLSDNLTFSQIYGSAELNSLKSGSQEAKISAEFPVPLDEFDYTNGGFYLCHLTERHCEESLQHYIDVSWTDLSGSRHSRRVELIIPPTEGEWCDLNLRKAITLAEYVQCLTDYALIEDDDDDMDEDNEDLVPRRGHFRRGRGGVQTKKQKSSPECSIDSLQQLLILTSEGIVSLDNVSQLPNDTPQKILKHYFNASRFRKLRYALYDAMALCNDCSLSTNNQNVVQTIDQIIELETKEIEQKLNKLREEVNAVAQIETGSASTTPSTAVPRGLMCPISLSIMNDPVIAADGHSYDRTTIEKWFEGKQNNGLIMSPLTNLPLIHTNLIPNHSLKMVIQEFLQQSQQQQSNSNQESSNQESSTRKSKRINK